MPMAMPYRNASRDWRGFLDDVMEYTGLVSDNAAYTGIDGVFRAFRRRLTVEQAILFANVLPAVPRAIFIQDWDVGARPVSYAPRETMIHEARTLRQHHNIAPETILDATARALWRRVNHADLRRVLAEFGPIATAFWTVQDADTRDLATRIG